MQTTILLADTDVIAQTQVKAVIQWREPILALLMTLVSLSLTITSHGASIFSLRGISGWFKLNNLVLSAPLTTSICTLVAIICSAVITTKAIQHKKTSVWLLLLAGISCVFSFLTWVVCDQPNYNIPIIQLLSGTVVFAVPLTFGALSGVICERSGIINIAIEGQLLFGAFLAAISASVLGMAWLGLLFAPMAGMLVAVLLALFTIKYRCNHIVIGVVLNMLVFGFTSFMYASVLRPNEGLLNIPVPLGKIAIPFLSDIPLIGPVLFKQNILLYLMIAIVILLNYYLFKSKWGLRTRACGEHPKAADTVGIKVNRLRWQNTILAGGVAGLGGACFTIGSGLAFSNGLTAGNGFIALAAMILGAWRPFGTLMAALLFGFATSLGYVMQTVNSPIPYEFLLMIPYIMTIFAVVGFVGRVRPPAAEGIPYP